MAILIERDVEQRLIRRVETIGGLTFKLTSPSSKGVPDRIVVYKGQVWFVELKSPKGKSAALQVYWKCRLRGQGANVKLIGNFDEVDNFIEQLKGD